MNCFQPCGVVPLCCPSTNIGQQGPTGPAGPPGPSNYSQGYFNLTFESEIWTVPTHTVTVEFTKIGNQVTITFPTLLAASNGTAGVRLISTDNPLPSNLIPRSTVNEIIPIIQNGGIASQGILIVIGTADSDPDHGIIIINPLSGDFGNGDVGFLSFSLSYNLDV